MTDPEKCPHHPPANTLVNVACRTCGAFKVKVDVERVPRSLLVLAFELLVDVAGRDPSPDDPSHVPIPITTHNAILSLVAAATNRQATPAAGVDEGGPAREPDDVEEQVPVVSSDVDEHQLQCARDEELAAVVAHVRAVATSMESLGGAEVARSLRMMAEALLVGAHRRTDGDRSRVVPDVARIMRAGQRRGGAT